MTTTLGSAHSSGLEGPSCSDGFSHSESPARPTRSGGPAGSPSRTARRRRRTSRRLLRWAVPVLAAVAGAAVGIVLTVATGYLLAPAVDTFLLLMALSLLVGAGAVAGAGALLHHPRVSAALAGVVVVAVVGAVTAVVQPDHGAGAPGAAVDPRGAPEMWRLSTGSRVAVWQRPAAQRRHQTPVVFLHGGPGMYTTTGAMARGEALREAGFDTVYFDQAGSGASDRLPVVQYGFRRAIDDVEALRVRLGAPRIVLWGSSYGASLAAAYTAEHPGRVAGLVLTSPGTFPGRASNRDYSVTGRRTALEPPPVLTAAMVLMDSNPRLAESFLGQAKAGRIFDEYITEEHAGSAMCAGADPRAFRNTLATQNGGNLFATHLISADVPRYRMPTTRVDVVALIVRGACDYMPREHAQRYAEFAGSAEIIDVPGDGHGLSLHEQQVRTAIGTFARTRLARVP